MAKYRLNNRLIECNILDENLLADTYTIKMNGSIRNVPRKKVSNLDHIDEAVLDKLRRFASSLWDNIIKKGKYAIMKIKGIFVPVSSPINAMVAAQNIDGVSFYPSEELANAAEDAGFEANVIEDAGEEDEEYIEDVREYWRKEIEKYKRGEYPYDKTYEDDVNESYHGTSRRSRLYEGRSLRRERLYEPHSSRRPKLYEADEAKYELASKAWKNYSAQQILTKLIDQFDRFQKGAAKGGSASIPIPYCIWGVPGIGKTQIIEQLVELMNDEIGNVNMMSINAMSMRKDDFAFPVRAEQETEVVNSKGENVKYRRSGGLDILKTWLPAYKPGDPAAVELGITDEQLDDIANGGNGSGNGNGGVIFFDELSRISPDVLNIIMTLVQNRQFNDYVIGSKWMMVAAANPPQVLATRAADNFQWDDAQTDRFQHVFYVPTFQEWLVWAQQPIKGTNTPRVDEDIVNFLKKHPECWINIQMRYTENKKDKVASSKYPNPRGWANASKGIRDEMNGRAEENDPNSLISRINARRGIRPRPAKLSHQEKADIINANVGISAARAYSEYYAFDGIFSSDIAESVWVDGETADIPFDGSGLNLILDRAINKIFDCHPEAAEEHATITPEQFKNLCTYVVRCVDMMDENSGASRDVVMTQAVQALFDRIKSKPFKLNMNLPEVKEQYKEGLAILANRSAQTRSNIRNMRN